MTDQQELSCPNCRARIYATDAQCISCGVRLDAGQPVREPRREAVPTPRRAEAHSERTAWPSFRRVFVVAAIIGVALCVFPFLVGAAFYPSVFVTLGLLSWVEASGMPVFEVVLGLAVLAVLILLIIRSSVRFGALFVLAQVALLPVLFAWGSHLPRSEAEGAYGATVVLVVLVGEGLMYLLGIIKLFVVKCGSTTIWDQRGEPLGATRLRLFAVGLILIAYNSSVLVFCLLAWVAAEMRGAG